MNMPFIRRWLGRLLARITGHYVVERERWEAAQLALELLDDSWEEYGDRLYNDQGVNQAHRHLAHAVGRMPLGAWYSPTRAVRIDTDQPF